MTNDQTLRAVAEAATPGPWRQLDQYVDCDVGPLPIATGWYEHATMDGGDQHDAAVANARFISTFDPPTVLSLLDRLAAAEAKNEELIGEAELFDQNHADQNRMVDRIADLIGLPHDQELGTTAFELWFSENATRATTARADGLREAAEIAERATSIYREQDCRTNRACAEACDLTRDQIRERAASVGAGDMGS